MKVTQTICRKKLWKLLIDRGPNKVELQRQIGISSASTTVDSTSNPNSDSKRKLELGRAWQNATHSHFKYFMVFKDHDVQLEGAYQLRFFKAASNSSRPSTGYACRAMPNCTRKSRHRSNEHSFAIKDQDV